MYDTRVYKFINISAVYMEFLCY